MVLESQGETQRHVEEHSGAKLGGPALSSHQRENNLKPNTYIFGATHQAHITENKFLLQTNYA